MVSTGTAFYQPEPVSGNYMEYHYRHLGRPGRRMIVDRVVKYKYPPQIGTIYQKEHGHFNSSKAVGRSNTGEPFNVEKEHKIINPHKVEKLTINRIDYQPYKIQPREPKKLKAPAPKQYIPQATTYQSSFKNWGPNEIIHEKDPQYPFYSLPFNGNSSYARTFCGGDNKGKTGRGVPFGFEALKHQYNAKKGDPGHGKSVDNGGHFGSTGAFYPTQTYMGKSATNLKPLFGGASLGNYFETTNQRNYKNYHLKHRPQTCKPKFEVVKNLGNKGHFKTTNKVEHKRFKHRPLAVDMIPYP